MKKLTKILVFALVLVMIFGTVYSSAYEPYDTYTYSIDGVPMKSPTAYSAEAVYDTIDMGIGDLVDKEGLTAAQITKLSGFNLPSDIVSDDLGNVYVADKGNNRVVVLDKYFKAKKLINTYVDDTGVPRSLKEPTGIFISNTVSGESHIYVCDTGNAQIVVFTRDFEYVRTIQKPKATLLKDVPFDPQHVAVDLYGRIFITSTSCYEGVIVLSAEGEFTGFIGAQTVSKSFIDILWDRLFKNEGGEKTYADPYNNITVDENGFVYVTTEYKDGEERQAQLATLESKTPGTSPVKKLNSAGQEIMKRNGFFDPSGEVAVLRPTDLSVIVDVAIGPEGSWTILDKQHSRLFTYDDNGNLLFAFGDKGDQMGHGKDFVGMTYHVVDDTWYILALDNTSPARITVFTPTPYHATIMKALHNQNNHNHEASIEYWQEVLTKNNNFDLAYIGIGKALYNQGKYKEAMDMLSNAYEVDNYAKAFNELRKAFISKWLLPMAIGIIVLLVLVFKFLGYAKRKNKAVTLKPGRKTYWEELIFAFHLVFHPFDGFWDLKHEKRGSVRGALTFIGLTILAFFYQAVGQGYTFNPKQDYSTIMLQVGAVLVPVILWCVSNWCLTTLFDGEGSFKDVVVATGYSLAPLPLFVILSTILTNVITSTEGSMVNLLVSIGYIWVALLLFFGMLVTHDYALNKNFVTTLGTILAMAVIMFIIILFFSLIVKMVTFIIAIVSEVADRI